MRNNRLKNINSSYEHIRIRKYYYAINRLMFYSDMLGRKINLIFRVKLIRVRK